MIPPHGEPALFPLPVETAEGTHRVVTIARNLHSPNGRLCQLIDRLNGSVAGDR